jgi:hypothetical protein
LNNARCAQLFVESLAKKIPEGGLKKYAEGRIPSEVKSWREFVGKRAWVRVLWKSPSKKWHVHALLKLKSWYAKKYEYLNVSII